jgi:3-isopropylmalate/(R)-2-methylmalate dehydratase small subunit
MISGRVWKFGDFISTDLMLPGPCSALSENEQMRWIFQANRPNWVNEVRPGDIIVGGKSFGVGSGRPAARSLRNIGVACLIAESITRLFFRNAVNFGLLALECPGVSAAFEEAQVAEVSVQDWTVRNASTGAVLKITPIPESLVALMQSGGIFPVLEREGFVGPRPDPSEAVSAPPRATP